MAEHSWNWMKLGTLSHISGGYGFPKIYQNGESGTIPFIKVSDFSMQGNERYIFRANNYVTSFTAEKMSWKTFPEGSIVFAKVGAALKLNRRRILTQDTIIDNNLMAVIPNPELRTEFAYHFLMMVDFNDFVQDGVLPSVNQLQIANILIPCLPLNEQTLIADILNTIDDTIHQTQQLIKKLKDIRTGLLHDLLTYGIDTNGDLRNPVHHPEQFKESRLGLIPKDWEVTNLGAMTTHIGSGLTPRGGRDVYQDSGVLFLRSQNIQFDGLRLDDVAYINNRLHTRMKASEVFPFDVLLNITGASIGRCTYMPANLGSTNVNQHVCIIRLMDSNEHNAIFVSAILGSHIGQSQIARINTGGSREGLNYSQVHNLLIPYPKSDSERSIIANTIQIADMQIHSEHSILSKLQLIKRGIDYDLLNGKVRVLDLLDSDYGEE